MSRIKRRKIEFDAAGEAPGRLASRIAHILIGKHKPSYVPHIDAGDRAVVKNFAQVVFTGKKLEQKEYIHHSMHPGGLKTKKAGQVAKDHPEEIIRNAVSKMLPRNKFRTPRMKRLSFIK